MSNQVNTELLERAAEVITYFEGTDLDLAVQRAIDNNELEILAYLVQEAEAEIFRQDHIRDFVADDGMKDEMTDERAEAMYVEQSDVF